LIQKLFSELDPHKKGFLNINDWRNAFKTFNSADQLIVELKNAVASTFSNCDSVFQFFLNFSGAKVNSINNQIFEKAVNALTSERFKKVDI
jgi:Ca2+-binding EF-hand superfamily protein